MVGSFDSNPGSAILQLDGTMVGPPFIKYARRILSTDG